MDRRKNDRRRSNVAAVRPPKSPANLLILAIAGVLGATAAATAVLGPGYDEQTPHGQLLGDLQRVAEAQERHYQSTGEFARWTQTLRIEPTDSVRLTVLRGNAEAWEALAEHPVGLACAQAGSVDARGRVVREKPGCFTTASRRGQR